MDHVQEDPRISPVHISLYMAILHCWRAQGCRNPICVYAKDLMPVAKISGVATYHRSIRQLDEYGYIKYSSSRNHVLGSLVYLLEWEKGRQGQLKMLQEVVSQERKGVL
ncbi:MAG TPA: hypothetical protein VMH27_11640 [Puia sp.]|nr:hypothetical protein [Puia sp.]